MTNWSTVPETGTGGETGVKFFGLYQVSSFLDYTKCDEEQTEECHDEVVVVEVSAVNVSPKPILRLPERNEEDTVWTRVDDTKSPTGKNKVTRMSHPFHRAKRV